MIVYSNYATNEHFVRGHTQTNNSRGRKYTWTCHMEDINKHEDDPEEEIKFDLILLYHNWLKKLR